MTVMTEHCHWGLAREKPDSDEGKKKQADLLSSHFPWLARPGLRFPCLLTLFTESVPTE